MEKNYQLSYKEFHCSVSVEYDDYHDGDDYIFRTTEHCDFEGMHYLFLWKFSSTVVKLN